MRDNQWVIARFRRAAELEAVRRHKPRLSGTDTTRIPMFDKAQLASILQETERIIQWAVSIVPRNRLLEAPPHGDHPQSGKGFKTYFGDWPALRQLFHLTFYESTYAIPAMERCMDGPRPDGDLVFPDPTLENKAWHDAVSQGPRAEQLLERLHELREQQLRLLQAMSIEQWQGARVETGLGTVSGEFVVSKTIQHSLEHANELMKNALYWERALNWLDRQALT